ncbi:aminotransferase class V-fold PLP-dependent enzyme [Arcobacter sp.]|uniref:aminotransferase class V-fold PLP-dependent enzyme n=1 Tax=Arcobacter sp. TaxID=1872629 RepID=UPI003C730DE1
MNDNLKNGELFDIELLKKIRKKFSHVNIDPKSKEKRLFFDNSGGAFRLKAASKVFKYIDEYPDCPEHGNKTAKWLMEIQEKGYESIKTMLNFDSGSIITSYTASTVMFNMIRAVIENVAGKNIVTTALEHPSSYDAVVSYANKNNKEVRVAKTNPKTGGVDVQEIVKLIDKNTSLLVFMYASNISGALLDAQKIVKECRKIKPDLFIIADAVQHAPHGIIDIKKVPVDGLNFAPYKFFGPRGFGVGYASKRLAKLSHDKLIAKPEDFWELGSPAPSHFAALTEVLNYVCWIGKHYLKSKNKRELFEEGMTRIKLHERALMYFMLEGTSKTQGLRSLNGVKVYLDCEDLRKKDFIMAIGFDKLGFKKAVKEYEKQRVITFERVISSPFSSRMLESFDLKGSIRVSPLHCHSLKDIEKFLKITRKISQLS